MPGTIITGQGGTVAWASDATADVGVTAWTLEISTSLTEITSIDDSDGSLPAYRNFTPGRKDWTATVDTVDAKFDPSQIGIAEASLALGDGGVADITLAKALCTNVSYSSTQDDVVRTTFTFVSSGDPGLV